MKDMYYLSGTTIMTMLLQQIACQQQLIEAQQQIIESQRENAKIQRKLDKMKPSTPKDKDIFWHLVSDGLSSHEAATCDDLITVLQFDEWINKFGAKHIKPYVNPKVYNECLNQMSRGLPQRIAQLRTQKERSSSDVGHLPTSGNGKKSA